MSGASESLLQRLSRPVADALGLHKLPEHVNTITCAFSFFLFVHAVLAPAVSQRWLKGAGRRGKNNWYTRVVSTVHVLIVVPLAWRCIGLEALEKDRAFGWDPRVGSVQGVAIGYFIWDLFDSVVNFVNFGFVVHAIMCITVYLLGFRPFLAYYGIRFLLWEISTIFLNIHWFLDKTGETGTSLQLINGAALLATFFGVRIVYGGKISYEHYYTLYEARDDVPAAQIWLFASSNVILQYLNWLWFSKMIRALRKRFPGSKLKDVVENRKAGESDTVNELPPS